MATNRVAGLIDHLGETQLLPPAQLEEIKRNPLAQVADPRPLAQELVQRNWLTRFQVDRLLQGNGKELVLGPYHLLDQLGEGAMGQVFKARHERMDRVVALKVIRQDRLANPEAVRRFCQEVKAAAQLCHPNIVLAYDAGQIGPTLYFAMEYVEGTDLARLVEQSGPLPVRQACEYIRQAACGLVHAHEKGLVHRDIKPGNLLLASGGRQPGVPPGANASGAPGTVKILDLGLARLGGAAAKDRLTRLGTVVGTPYFMSPEQASDSHAVDIRSDLYSLGCTLYFLLAGKPPFQGESATDVMLMHQVEPPPPLDEVRADVPSRLWAIIAKLLAKKPQDRYQTAAELIDALNALERRGKKRLLLLTAGAALLAMGLMTWLFVAPGSREEMPGSPRSTENAVPPEKKPSEPDNKNKGRGWEKWHEHRRDFRGQVKTVDVPGRTLLLSGKDKGSDFEKTFRVSKIAKVRLKSGDGDLADIKPGMFVKLEVIEGDTAIEVKIEKVN
jgi:serine/threonine-protein kinase